MNENPDLEVLIARVAMGDRDAFLKLYDATSGKLFAVSLRVLRQRSIAEDAMQDTFVKVWKNAGRYRVTGHSPMTWLITIARNTAIDRLRAQRNHGDIDTYRDTLQGSEPTPEQSVLARDETRLILGCLNELDQDKRDAIRGAYLDGDSYKDLSARFAVPLNTMRTWLRRGLASLRECMSR